MNKKRFSLLVVIGLLALILTGIFFMQKKIEPHQVTFFVDYNGTSLVMHTGTENNSVEEALIDAGYQLTPGSDVIPDPRSPLFAGTVIKVMPAQRFTIQDEHQAVEFTRPATTVRDALFQSGTQLLGADFVEPSAETSLSSGDTIQVTRVTVSEESEDTSIPFKKVEEEDDKLSWQTKKVTQKGELGIRTTRYKVSRHNGKIVAKEKIEEVITKEPVNQKTVIGTKVTVIRKHTGGASWYAHTGTLSAANPWMPIGSYARVTNTSNGKKIIVRINDRGPFGAGRIIDLDKVAFEKIADLGTGVINVLMEEIK